MELSSSVFNKLTSHEPAIQSKTSTWSAVNFNKTRDLNELWTWARDMVTWYWLVDNLTWQVSVDHNTMSYIRKKNMVNQGCMSPPTCYLEYGRHLVRLHHHCCAYAPMSNTANHDNHEKRNSWVSFCFLYGYGAPLGGPSSASSWIDSRMIVFINRSYLYLNYRSLS